MAYTTVATGQTIEAAHHNEIVKSLNGTSGYGQAVSLTQLNDASNYALDARNLDSTNGYVARFKDESDVSILTLTRAVATFGKKVAVTVTAAFTAAADMLAITATWNAAGGTFNAIKANITNTASASTSRLLDLRVGGASVFSVDVNGDIATAGSVPTAALEDSAVTPVKIANRTRRFMIPVSTFNTATLNTGSALGMQTSNTVDCSYGGQAFVPDDYESGMTVTAVLYNSSLSAGDVVVQVTIDTSTAIGETTPTQVLYGETLAIVSSATQAVYGTTSIQPDPGMAKGDLLLVSFTRDSDSASDTFAGSILYFTGWLVEYTADS